MKYRKLGRTDFEVSDMAQGLWGMSGWSGSDDRESLDAMQLAVDSGCTFFDTAWAYGDGKSDGLLAQILARNPGKRIYAASKIQLRIFNGRRLRKISAPMYSPPRMYSNIRNQFCKSSARSRSICCNCMSGTIAGPTNLNSAVR